MKKSALATLALISLYPTLGERLAHADSADNDPVVDLAPSSGRAFVDKPLPASVYFKLHFEPSGSTPSMMVARVWPWATLQSCKVKPKDLTGTRQFHEIAMLSNKDPDHPAFEARVPPLQVGQRFCISIQSFVPLSGDLLDAFAEKVAEGVVARLSPPSDRIDQILRGQAPPSTLNQSKDFRRQIIAEQLEIVFEDQYEKKKLHDAQGAAGKALALINEDSINNFLTASIKYQLAHSSPPSAAPSPPSNQTTNASQGLAPAGKAATGATNKAAAAIGKPTTNKPAAANKPTSTNTATPGEQTPAGDNGTPPASPESAPDQDPTATALDVAKKALTENIKGALTSDSVKAAFTYDQIQSGSSFAGEGDSASAANYAAIDTGVVAAFPLGYAGGNGTPWALPYIGLNLYFTPVDRTVPLSQLVDQAGQRFSLTIGRTLSNPSLPNRTITDFGFGYPVFACGYRVSQFVRTTAGAVFYKINVENPTSANTVFGVAPFIGMALDGDVIAIAQGKLFSPN